MSRITTTDSVVEVNGGSGSARESAWIEPNELRRRRRLYSIGFPLAAVAICIQFLRDDGFLSASVSTLQRASTAAENSSEAALFADRVFQTLLQNLELDGEQALQECCGLSLSLLTAGHKSAIAVLARDEESIVEALTRSDWRLRADLYRAIGELHSLADSASPLTIERSGDALVASADTLRLVGEFVEAQIMIRRAMGRYRQAERLVAPDGRSFRARLRGKVGTLESNLRALESARDSEKGRLE